MADQLCGQFYAQLLGLPDIVPRSRAQSALKKIYEACFVKFNQQHSEKLEVANGVRLRCAHATANYLKTSPTILHETIPAVSGYILVPIMLLMVG